MKQKQPLTAPQHECLEAIIKYIGEHDHYPTIRELAEILNKAEPTVFELRKKLKEKRYLTRHNELPNNN